MRDTTYTMASLLPSWMKIRQSPETTQGGQLLDTISAQVEDLAGLLDSVLITRAPAIDPYYRTEEGLITGSRTDVVDLYGVDIIYRVPLAPVFYDYDDFLVVAGDRVLRRCTSVFDFYRPGEPDKYYYDQDDRYLYLLQAQDRVLLNNLDLGATRPHAVWGPYDEIGLLLGCPRLPLERNDRYRTRLLDVFQSPPGAHRQGLLNHIARQLDVPQARVRLSEFDDAYIARLCARPALEDELWSFIDLSRAINQSVGASYWDVIDNYRKGVRYLPIQWTATLDSWTDAQVQDGIGDGDDLLVTAPQQLTNTQEFQYQVGVQGKQLLSTNRYPDITFDYKVYATGQIYDEFGSGINPETYGFTVLSAPLVPVRATITLEQDYLDGTYHSVEDFTNPAVDMTVISNANAPDGVTIRKESGTYTYLEMLIPIQDYDRNTDRYARPEDPDSRDKGPIGFNNITIDFVNNNAEACQIIFTNYDFNGSSYHKVSGTPIRYYVPISGKTTFTSVDDVFTCYGIRSVNIGFHTPADESTIDDQNKYNGAYLNGKDYVRNYFTMYDFATNGRGTTGCRFLTNNTFSIDS